MPHVVSHGNGTGSRYYRVIRYVTPSPITKTNPDYQAIIMIINDSMPSLDLDPPSSSRIGGLLSPAIPSSFLPRPPQHPSILLPLFHIALQPPPILPSSHPQPPSPSSINPISSSPSILNSVSSPYSTISLPPPHLRHELSISHRSITKSSVLNLPRLYPTALSPI